MRFTFSVALIFFLSLFPAQAQNLFTEESAQQSDLREAIFRYMFDHYKMGSGKIFCIQPERPLPQSFLRRFTESKFMVVWASECDFSGPLNGARYQKTAAPALIMTILDIRSINAQEAEAKVEAFHDGIAANWNSLHFIRRNDRWIVKSDKIDAIS